MLQAAAHRLSRTSLAQLAQDPPSSLSPSPSRPSAEQRSTRRLSKISASEFDSVLSAGDTVRIKSREPELGESPAEQAALDSTTAVPARQGSSRDLVSTAFPFDGSSTRVEPFRRHEGDASGGAIAPTGHSLESADPAGTSRALDMASPAGTNTSASHYDSLVAVGAIDPAPTPRSRRNSTVPPASDAIPVAFPSRGDNARPPPMMHTNPSNSTLATAFGLSPRRRRVQSDETVQERVSVKHERCSRLVHGVDLAPRHRSPLWVPCARRADSFASSAHRVTRIRTRSALSCPSVAKRGAR